MIWQLHPMTLIMKQRHIIDGANNKTEFDIKANNDGHISSEDVINNVNPICKINLLDIQACYCAKPAGYNYTDINWNIITTTTCIAYEFYKKEKIQKVYAWTDECKFLAGWNCSLKGGAYQEYYLFNNEVIHFTVKSDTYMKFLDFIPLYAPLQY